MAEHEPANLEPTRESQHEATEELSDEELTEVAGGVLLPYMEQENVTGKVSMQDFH